MNIAERKKSIIEKVMNLSSEEKLLQIEKLMLSDLESENETIAFTIVGEPVNRETYAKLVKQAENSIANGHYLSQEDLEKESETW